MLVVQSVHLKFIQYSKNVSSVASKSFDPLTVKIIQDFECPTFILARPLVTPEDKNSSIRLPRDFFRCHSNGGTRMGIDIHQFSGKKASQSKRVSSERTYNYQLTNTFDGVHVDKLLYE